MQNSMEVKKKTMNILLIILYLIFTVSGLICYKYGTNINFEVGIKNSNLIFNVNVIALLGLLLYVFSFLLYMLVLPKFNLTYLFPIMSAITAIGVYVSSIIFLKEEITIQKIIGCIIIIVGVFIMNYNGDK